MSRLKTVTGQWGTTYDVSTIFHTDRHLRLLTMQLKQELFAETTNKTLGNVNRLYREIDILLDARLDVMPGKSPFLEASTHGIP